MQTEQSRSVKDHTANLHIYRKSDNFTTPPLHAKFTNFSRERARSHLILMSSSLAYEFKWH